MQDILTPVFIFERLCSIIYPEENDIGEFFLTLEKDPQQEDFLQGTVQYFQPFLLELNECFKDECWVIHIQATKQV